MKRTALWAILLALWPSLQAAAVNFDFQDIGSGLYFKIVDNGVEIVRGTSLNRGDITIPQTVTYKGTTYDVVSINSNTWELIYDLKSITMKKGSIAIAAGAFYKCTQLASVELPENIIIYGLAFSGCTSLADLKSHDFAPTPFNDNCFDTSTYKTCTLHVPLGTLALYKATAGWKNFLNITEDASMGIVLDEKADNATRISKGKGQKTDIKLLRTLSADHWNTLCVPFSISESQLKAVFGGAEVRRFTQVEGSVMVFSKATSIEAGIPYLMQPNTTVENPTFSDATISQAKAQAITVSAGGNTFSFVGAYSPYDMATDGTEQYLGPGNLLYIPAAGTNQLYGLAAYYRIPWDSKNNAKIQLTNEYQEEATNIEVGKLAVGQAMVFNLQGAAYKFGSSLPKGIYIVNKKKYIVK